METPPIYILPRPYAVVTHSDGVSDVYDLDGGPAWLDPWVERLEAYAERPSDALLLPNGDSLSLHAAAFAAVSEGVERIPVYVIEPVAHPTLGHVFRMPFDAPALG